MISGPAQRRSIPVDPSPVAVIIPSCDRPTLLTRAIGSVLDQTLRPTELVVADVGGRSWSNKAAAAIRHDHPIRTLRLDVPAGTAAGAARNRGASASSASVLAFLDDDDTWDAEYLRQAMTALDRDNLECVITPIRIRKGTVTVRMPSIPPRLSSGDDALTDNWSVTGSSLVITRAAFNDLAGYDDRLYALNDLEFLIRLLDRRTRYGVTAEPYVEQLIHDGPQLTRATEARLRALDDFLAVYGGRMSHAQRIYMRRERHRVLKHLAAGGPARAWHYAADITLTRPSELLTRARRRLALRGGYD